MGNNIKKFNELKYHSVNNHIDDINTYKMSIGDDIPFEIYISGGEGYKISIPNFTLKYNDIEISIIIPNISEWKKNKILNIAPYNSTKKNDIDDINIKVIEWLDARFPLYEDITNIENLRIQWNVLNSDNNLAIKFTKTH